MNNTAKIEKMKQLAAEASLEFISSETILGLGTGTTVDYLIKVLPKVKNKIEGIVASSEVTASQVKALGISLFDLNSVNELHVYIDGADEVDRYKNLLKGGRGALTREKIISRVAKSFVCIVDETKQVDYLGTHPVSVEVIPIARSYVARHLVAMGGDPVYRSGYLTDNGNAVIDVFNFKIMDPLNLESGINNITGVLENGIFAHRKADIVLVGTTNGIKNY